MCLCLCCVGKLEFVIWHALDRCAMKLGSYPRNKLEVSTARFVSVLLLCCFAGFCKFLIGFSKFFRGIPPEKLTDT